MDATSTDKIAYLTFDDGPNEPYTSQILEILEQFGARATFFVCGKNVRKYPGLAARIAAGGHALGNHSFSHLLWETLLGDVTTGIAQTQQLINPFNASKLYRSPWGITPPWAKKKLQEAGYTIVPWNIMAFDWYQPKPEFIADHIVSRIFPGAIILLHDGEKTNTVSRAATAAALPLLLQRLTDQGYQCKELTKTVVKPKNIPMYFFTDLFLGLRYFLGTM